MQTLKAILLFVTMGWLICTNTHALETGTHRKINEKVAEKTLPSGFNLNSYLISNLGFSQGISEIVMENKTVQRLLELGGE